MTPLLNSFGGFGSSIASNRPTSDMVVVLGKLGQCRLEIKAFGDFKLTRGRRGIQFYDRDLLNFI